LNQEEIEESGESAENLVALEESDVDDEPVDADRDEDERHLGVNVIKLFISVIYEYSYNNLERLSLASLSSLVLCLQVRPEPTRVKHLSDAPH